MAIAITLTACFVSFPFQKIWDICENTNFFVSLRYRFLKRRKRQIKGFYERQKRYVCNNLKNWGNYSFCIILSAQQLLCQQMQACCSFEDFEHLVWLYIIKCMDLQNTYNRNTRKTSEENEGTQGV